MGKAELKPCPFCGKNAHVYATSYPNGEKAFCVCCLHYFGCYLENSIGADFETEADAVRAWNERADNDF